MNNDTHCYYVCALRPLLWTESPFGCYCAITHKCAQASACTPRWIESPVAITIIALLIIEQYRQSQHSNLSGQSVDREIKALKRAAALSKLAALRATSPDPPMVSVLDLEQHQAEQTDPEAGVIMCQKRTCVNARLRVRELEREVADVRAVSENT